MTMKTKQRDRWGGWAFVLAGALAAGCAHKTATEPEAKEAVAATRGLCPTDVHQTLMIVREGQEEVAVGFRSRDDSKIEELSRRAAELGEALASVHPAINASGQLIQHTAAVKPELRELAGSPDGRGVELVFRTGAEQKPTLLANLRDHERLWRQGECPIMSDESVKARETRGWTRVDR